MSKKAEEAVKTAKKAEEAAPQELAIEVGDPLVLRPVELPLVVKPANGGEWLNDAQAEYAKVLNGYAYKNPTKWESKKAVLVAQLKDLAAHPRKLNVLTGESDASGGKLSYKNKAIES